MKSCTQVPRTCMDKHLVLDFHLFAESAYETNFFYFVLRRSIKNWKTAVYRFSISYLVLELNSFEDAKIKAKSTDMKHAILVTSHTLNKYSLDS